MKSVSASEFLEAVLESRRTNDEPTVICPSGHITLDDTRHQVGLVGFRSGLSQIQATVTRRIGLRRCGKT